MGKDAITGIIAVGTAIIGLAILAVVLSQKSNTTNVITSAGTALSNAIKAAISPVTTS